jgi:hypothetical protein
VEAVLSAARITGGMKGVVSWHLIGASAGGVWGVGGAASLR